MARRIQSADEAAGEPPIKEVPEGGVCFVNNLLNRKFTLPSGREFKFSRTRETFTSKEEIDYLTKLTKTPGSYIFLFEVEPSIKSEPAPAPETEPAL